MSDSYAVFGNPIAHSKSPLIHAEFARQTGQDMRYEAILAPLDGFPAAVVAFCAAGGRGANVTVPFKLEAYALCGGRLSERARAAGAVNTLSIGPEGISGDNTDGVGLVADIRDNLAFPIQGRRILLLGAGGAARGVILPLLSQAPESLTIANRTAEKAVELARLFSGAGAGVTACALAELAGRHFDLVINATAASLSDQAPELPDGLYAEGSMAYDMVYGKGLTPFLTRAGEQGAAHLADGLGMLIEQAAEAFFVWRGVRPPTASVFDMLRLK
ncbi:MAG: shikimate dehydrogenase [Rhodocyclaceae bacterium]|nr:shikimate dehydrogenase [Rhodocyclaceae bacterium]